MVGGAFETVSNILPFSHVVKAAQAAVAGDYGAIFPELWWIVAYAVVLTAAAIKLKKN
jgi:ABC-2 type transport system permease protein